jgi:hypothetical protein
MTTRKPRKSSSGEASNPAKGQFQKGVSGNPNGRPLRSKSLHSELLDIGNEKIMTREGGKAKKISKTRAAIMLLFSDALSRKPRALKDLIDRVVKAEEANAALAVRTFPISDLDSSVVDSIYKRMQACKKQEKK